MLGRFYILLGVLSCCIAGVSLHYLSSSPEAQRSTSLLSLIKMAEPSLSVSYYESRLLTEKSLGNPSYPSMQTIDKREYIYAK